MNKLLQVIQREVPLRIISPEVAVPKPRVNPLLNRLQMLKEMDRFQDRMYTSIRMLHLEARWIRRLPSLRMDLFDLEIAVERYPGRAPWWVDQEFNEYVEIEFKTAPKVQNYTIGSYWETREGVNTEQFILDRAKWVYKYIGKQIKLARRLLRIAKSWNFSQEQTEGFEKLYNKLGAYF